MTHDTRDPDLAASVATTAWVPGASTATSLLSAEQPVYYGWLWFCTRGLLFRKWRQRFFVLRGHTLVCFTRSCVILTAAHGPRYVRMPSIGKLRVETAALHDGTTFGLKITGRDGRVWRVQAGDQATRLQWLQALTRQDQQQQEASYKPLRRFFV